MADSDKSSGWGTTGIVGIFLALMVGLGRSFGPSVPPIAGPRIATDSARAATDSGHRHIRVLDLLALLDTRLADLSTRRSRVAALIATVPDPIDSRGDWAFDANLEAIRHAFERVGYLPDRYWLPWTRDRSQRSGSGTGMLHDSVPGVLLFRARNGDGVRVVLLVGEVPTIGIQARAFQRALRDLDTLVGAQDTVRIVGPTYSGSARSVRLALNQYRRRTRRNMIAVLFSGDATGVTPDSALDSLNAFHFTVHPDLLLSTVRHHVTQAMGIDANVATLVEASTAYGQALNREQDADLRVLVPIGIGSLRSEYLDAQSSQPQDVPGRQAPFEISLRDPEGLVEAPQVQSRLTAPALALELDAVGEALAHEHRQAVGIFLTDIRDQLFLVREIRRRSHGILLFAHQSNSLFLWPGFTESTEGMVVITSYPLIPGAERWVDSTRQPGELVTFPREGAEGVFNATLFQLGADSGVEGYLPVPGAASRLPAIWVTAVGREGFVPLGVEFADRTQCYVAPQPMMAADTARARRCRAAGPAALIASPTSGARQRGILVRFVASIGAALTGNLPPGCGLALLLGALVAALAGYPRFFVNTWKQFPKVTTLRKGTAARVLWGSIWSHWHLYSILRGVALMGAAAPLGALVWAFHPQASLATTWLLVLAPTLIVLVPHFTGAARLIWTEWRSTRDFSRRARDRPVWIGELFFRTFTIVLGLAFGVGLIVFLLLLDRMNGPARLIMAYRVMHVTSGISPLIPIGVGSLGLFFWCSWHVQRSTRLMLATPLEQWALTAFDYNVTALPKPDEHAGLQRRLQETVTATRVRLFLLAQRRWSMVLLAVVLISGVLLGRSPARSVELYAFRDVQSAAWLLDTLYRVMVGALLACVVWGAYRLLSVWTGLRAFLTQVGASPLLGAFERLPEKVAGMARVSLLRKDVDASVELVAATQWRHLHHLFVQASGHGAKVLATMDQQVAARHRREDGPPVRSEAIFQEPAMPEGSRDVGLMFDALEFAWNAEPGEEDAQLVRKQLVETRTDEPQYATSGRIRRAASGQERVWLRALEEYVALDIVLYIEWVIDLMRQLSAFLVVTLVAATMLLLSHPAFDVAPVQAFFFGSLVLTIGTLVFVLVQMSSDDVLSRINGTAPGRVSWDSSFVVNILTFAAVPAFAIVSWVFPTVGAFLFSWAEPLLHSLGR